MNKNIQKTSKVRKKSSQGERSFLAAFVFGFLVTVVVWLVLSALVPLILASSGDAQALVPFVSPAVLVISLVLGGFASAKIAKSQGISCAILVGTAFLGLSYLLSSLLKLSNDMEVFMKTVYILLYIICPVLGARIAKNNKKTPGNQKRRGRM